MHLALDQLSAQDRDIVWMRHFDGLGYDEIAAACDITAQAVRNRLHRARIHLREQLGSVLHIQLQRGVRLTQGQ